MRKTVLPRSIRGKIIASTAAATIFIAAVTVTVCFFVFQSFLQRNQLRSAEYNLQTISGNVADHMESILYFSRWCAASSDISQYLDAFQDESRMPSISSENAAARTIALSAYDRLKEEFYNAHSSDYITRVVLSPSNLLNYMQIADTSAANPSRAPMLLSEQPFFEELLESRGEKWIGLIPDPLAYGENRPLVIPILRPIYNQFNDERTGWVYLSVSDRVLRNYLAAYPLEADAQLYVTIGGHSYRYERGALTPADFSYTILSDISDRTFSSGTSAYRADLGGGVTRDLVICPLGEEGWTITQVLSRQSYKTQGAIYTALSAAIASLIGIMGLALYATMSRMINRPVARLQSAIQEISQGDFSPKPDIEWGDELGDIGRGINRMAGDVATLMEKKVEDEKHRKDLEYQILQSQINPHFLYNTLNSIKWMATIQGAKGIAEMTTALARLMKNVSKGTAARIPLREELNLVKDYFLIQQYRYGGSITLDCTLESDELSDCLIQRFTLQPIVENALFHGIEPKGCAGKITIEAVRATLADGRAALQIRVTDNGVGMSAETIKRVLSGDAAPKADFFRQVGINNVNSRIQYDFGPSFGIAIESEEGEYTTMIITLPYETASGGTNK